MGSTPIYHLPYPESTDPPNGPAQFRALAEATEGALSAAVAFGTSAFSAGPNWSLVWAYAVRSGNFVSFAGRIASTIAREITATGNMVDGPMVTMPKEITPLWGEWQVLLLVTGSIGVFATVNQQGRMDIRAGDGTGTARNIPANATYEWGITYTIAPAPTGYAAPPISTDDEPDSP